VGLLLFCLRPKILRVLATIKPGAENSGNAGAGRSGMSLQLPMFLSAVIAQPELCE
jgi:hypothetical protein